MSLILMGKMDNGQTAPKALLDSATVVSLNEDIVRVVDNKKLIAVGEGVATIKITIGDTEQTAVITVGTPSPSNLIYLTMDKRSIVSPAGENIQIILG